MPAEEATLRIVTVRSRTREMVTAALIAAMMAAAAYATIPLQPVPVTLQVFFVVLAALLLRPTWSAAAMGVYIALGVAGVPVFSGGTGGVGVLAGPTGGYIIGFAAGATLGAVARIALERRGVRQVVADTLCVASAIAAVYVCGVSQLAIVAQLTPAQAAVAGALPFLGFDAVKGAVAIGAAMAIRRAREL